MNIFSKLYAKWFLQRTLIETTPFIYRTINNDINKKQWVCELKLYGTKREYKVLMDIKRSVFRDLGLSIPVYCSEVPLSVEKNTKKEIASVKRFNTDYHRFICSKRLRSSNTLKIVIPALSLEHGTGEVEFQFDAAIGFGGQIFFGTSLIGLGNIQHIRHADENRDKRFEIWKKNKPEWYNNKIEAPGNKL